MTRTQERLGAMSGYAFGQPALQAATAAGPSMSVLAPWHEMARGQAGFAFGLESLSVVSHAHSPLQELPSSRMTIEPSRADGLPASFRIMADSN